MRSEVIMAEKSIQFFTLFSHLPVLPLFVNWFTINPGTV